MKKAHKEPVDSLCAFESLTLDILLYFIADTPFDTSAQKISVTKKVPSAIFHANDTVN